MSSYLPAGDARRMMEYDARRKSVAVAYVIWFFLGWLGGHRFYLARTGSAVVMAVIGLLSLLTTPILIGYAGFGLLGLWMLLDLVLIPGIVRDHNLRLMHSLG